MERQSILLALQPTRTNITANNLTQSESGNIFTTAHKHTNCIAKRKYRKTVALIIWSC